MKKVLSIVTILVLVCVSMVSCSKESTEEKNEKIYNRYKDALVGCWKVVGQQESGNVYNCSYRLDGDYYVTFADNGAALCEGSAKAYGYYPGDSEFISEDVGDYLKFVRWNLEYSDVTGCDVWTYTTSSSVGSMHSVDFNEDGTIRIWFTGMRKWYYTLMKIKKQKLNIDETISGKWKLTKIQDFPTAINHYSIIGNNYVIFTSGRISSLGEFCVEPNGNYSQRYNLVFPSYKYWNANLLYENGIESSSSFELICNNTDSYIAYIVNQKKLDLVKFEKDKIHGIVYSLEKD